jgi:UPF0716 protein FxsA
LLSNRFRRARSGFSRKLALPLLLLPLAELALLIWIGRQTHWLVPTAWVLSAGMLGSLIASRNGSRFWRVAPEQLRRGEIPTDALLNGFLVLAASLLLIMPGLMSDAAALFLLVPAGRRLAKQRLQHWFARKFSLTKLDAGQHPAGGDVGSESVIDVSHAPAADDSRKLSPPRDPAE